MGSEGRRSAKYVATRKLFREGRLLCHICGQRPGVTVDHVPPLSSAPHPDLWRGQLKPACAHCNYSHGRRMRNGRRNKTNPSRAW